MNKIVVGNQKMNMSFSDISRFIDEIKGKINSNDVIICPSSIYVPYFLNHDFSVGMQDIFYDNKGAYTGFISPIQAKGMNINYTIIGHSERRSLNETDSIINKKVINATENELKVILCVGETLEEKSVMKTELVLRRQIFGALTGVKKIENVIIAYEPVWSIGSGIVPTKEEIEKIVLYIQKIVKQYVNYEDIPVIYGGSINSQNISDINSISILKGVLVGDASCNSSEFLKIKEVVLK